MNKLLKQFLIVILCHTSAWAQKKEVPYVLLVSVDGFRYDYVTKFNLLNFKSFIKTGAQADALIPSFPSKTFPNHYTIVTGLYPGNHGLVDNSFYDPARKQEFGMKNRKIVADPYYYGGTPLWRLAQQQGLKAAPYFWVGSEVPFANHYPDYYFPFLDTVSNQNRVDKVLGWLKLPQKDRPHFITLYFSSIDHAGHSFGTDSEELKKALTEIDALLGNLMIEIKDTHLPVNVILVSDHGMKQLVFKEDTYIYLGEILNLNDSSIIVINSGTHSHIYIDDKSRVDSVYNVLKKEENNFKVYKASEFPARWHYKNPRSGDILVTAFPGKEITTKNREQIIMGMKPGAKWGAHGYDPDEVDEMRGIFYASGPNINVGVNVPAFRNIHIYPFIGLILGLKIPAIDGSIKVLRDVYKP